MRPSVTTRCPNTEARMPHRVACSSSRARMSIITVRCATSGGVGTSLWSDVQYVCTDAQLLWWAVIFGANLGGNITPIGSASTLVAVTIIHKHGLRLSFGGFVRKALPFALMQIAIASVYLLWAL